MFELFLSIHYQCFPPFFCSPFLFLLCLPFSLLLRLPTAHSTINPILAHLGVVKANFRTLCNKLEEVEVSNLSNLDCKASTTKPVSGFRAIVLTTKTVSLNLFRPPWKSRGPFSLFEDCP